METRFIESIDMLIGYVKGMGEFAQAQAPLLVREMISYAIWGGLIGVVSIIVSGVGYGLLFRGILKYMDSDRDYIDDHPLIITTLVVVGIALILAVIAVIFFILPNMTKAIFAPRLYILNELKGLFK